MKTSPLFNSATAKERRTRCAAAWQFQWAMSFGSLSGIAGRLAVDGASGAGAGRGRVEVSSGMKEAGRGKVAKNLRILMA
jgi:hypothetical protein